MTNGGGQSGCGSCWLWNDGFHDSIFLRPGSFWLVDRMGLFALADKNDSSIAFREHSKSLPLRRLRQRHAKEFFAVVHIGAAIRECRMTPEHVASARVFLWIEELGAADFVVALRRQFREDQFALIVPDPAARRLLHQKSRGQKGFLAACGSVGLPFAVTARGVQTA